MQKILSKKFMIGSILVLLIIAGGVVWQKMKTTKAEKIAEEKLLYTVVYGDIESEVKVTAIASLVNEQNLSFGQPGKITNVFVGIGDEVVAGQVLAELNMDDYRNAIQTAELEVANAQLGLEKLLDNDTSLREAQLTAQLREVQGSYDLEMEQLGVLEKQLQTVVQQKNTQIQQAQRTYDLAKEGLDLTGPGLGEDTSLGDASSNRHQTFLTIKSTLDTVLGDTEAVIESIDEIFGVTETYSHQAEGYSRRLSTRNTQFKNETAGNVRQSYALLRKFSEDIDALNSNSSNDDIYAFIKDFYEESALLVELCDVAGDALDMTTAGSVLTETELQGFISTVQASRASTIGLRSQLQTLVDTTSSLLLSYDGQKVSLQKQQEDIAILIAEVATLEQDNNNQIKRKQNQIEILQQNSEILEKEIEDLLDGPSTYDIQQQKNLIRQTQLRLERSRDQQDDFQIIAEFDGRVRTVDIVAGEQYELDDRKFIVIENPDLIELKLQVSQIDMVKIKEGDPVKVTFDAYPNNPIYAKIDTRNVNPEPNGRGGVYYEATILLEKQEQEILAGMSALVTVTTDISKETLIIPTLAIVQQQGKQFVQLKKSDGYKLTEIEVGVMNNFQAEVISGIKQGDIIKSSALDEDALKDMGIDDASASPFG